MPNNPDSEEMVPSASFLPLLRWLYVVCSCKWPIILCAQAVLLDMGYCNHIKLCFVPANSVLL
jgi:hypothetical protein